MADDFVFPGIAGRVALVTGANHGIGAATAQLLAAHGAAVMLTCLRLDIEPDPAVPAAYATDRAAGADAVVEAIAAAGGRADTIECDLADPGSAAMLFDAAEARFGPVEILVNNANSWCADTFTASRIDRIGRRTQAVSPATHHRTFAVNAMAAALLIGEFARRHIERAATWGRIVGLTSGGPGGFPGEVSYGAAKGGAGELPHGRRTRTGRRRGDSQHGVPAGDRHRLGHRRGATRRRKEQRARPRRPTRRGRLGHRVPRLRPGHADHRQRRAPAMTGPLVSKDTRGAGRRLDWSG